jgi:hypothetical protein
MLGGGARARQTDGGADGTTVLVEGGRCQGPEWLWWHARVDSWMWTRGAGSGGGDQVELSSGGMGCP